MPINSIILQPESQSIHPAYRPIQFIVEATQPDPQADKFIPPVVYCDIYINGSFYKSMVSTVTINTPIYDDDENRPRFRFDIQDPCQEVLTHDLAPIGLSAITETTKPIAKVQVKFRAGYLSSEGFTEFEGIEPVQGTTTTPATPGTGTESNVFNVLNASIPHEEFDSLVNYLSKYKNGTWQGTAYPLSIRPSIYRICTNDHDVFPILHTGDKRLKCIRIKYKEKRSNTLYTETSCITFPACVAPGFSAEIGLPKGLTGIIYHKEIPLIGTGPFTIDEDNSDMPPAWLNVAIEGNNIVFFGVPGISDITAEALNIKIKVDNACGSINYESTLEVGAELICEKVAIVSTTIPDTYEGAAFEKKIYFTGTPTVILSDVVKPSWVSHELNSDHVRFFGTAGAASIDNIISFKLTNCGGSVTFSDTFDIGEEVEEGEGFIVSNESESGATITAVTPGFYLIYSGAFPLATSEQLLGNFGSWSTTIKVTIAGSASGTTLQLLKNGTPVESIAVTSAGEKWLNYGSPVVFASGDSMEIKLID